MAITLYDAAEEPSIILWEGQPDPNFILPGITRQVSAGFLYGGHVDCPAQPAINQLVRFRTLFHNAMVGTLHPIDVYLNIVQLSQTQPDHWYLHVQPLCAQGRQFITTLRTAERLWQALRSPHLKARERSTI